MGRGVCVWGGQVIGLDWQSLRAKPGHKKEVRFSPPTAHWHCPMPGWGAEVKEPRSLPSGSSGHDGHACMGTEC